MEGRALTLFRSDNMGDVVVSLWTAAWIKRCYPEIRLFMITRGVWEPIIRRCSFLEGWCSLEDFMAGRLPWSLTERGHIVFFFSRPEEARQARHLGFQRRTGTAHRWWHWVYSNDRIFFSRKRSTYHEAQLNLLLLRKYFPALWPCSLENLEETGLFPARAPVTGRPLRIVLHPFSNRSAPLWPSVFWVQLIRILHKSESLELFVTGLSKDQAEAERIIQDSGFSDVQNMCGKLSLQDLIHFLETADALVAPSTGPLHLAAAMGLRTVGLYVPRRPMHPGRWAPLGQDIRVLTGVAECRRSCSPALCPCMAAIQPSEVAAALGY